MIKYEAIYPTPFWRAAGLSGYTNTDRAPVHFTYDNSPPSGEPSVLLGFVAGQDARRLNAMSAAARRSEVLAAFVRLFGAAAGRPRQLVGQNWSTVDSRLLHRLHGRRRALRGAGRLRVGAQALARLACPRRDRPAPRNTPAAGPEGPAASDH